MPRRKPAPVGVNPFQRKPTPVGANPPQAEARSRSETMMVDNDDEFMLEVADAVEQLMAYPVPTNHY